MPTLLRGAIALGALAIVGFLILPRLGDAGRAFALLDRISPGYIAFGIALEVAAVIAFAQLTRSLLPREKTPRLGATLRMNLSTLAVNRVVPGGTVAGWALSYRLLTRMGITGTDAGFALAARGIGSTVILNLLLWIGLVVSIPMRGFDPLYLTAAIIGSLLIGGFLGLILGLTRGERRASAIACAISRRVPFVEEAAVSRGMIRITAHLRVLIADRALLVRAAGWAGASWLLSAASLGVFLAAFGHRVSADGLIVSFGIANVLAAIPVTPAGLGVVEAVLAPMLVGFGTPPAVAILGVIAYRTANFWLPIPAGGLAYLTLRKRKFNTRTGAQKLRQAAGAADGVSVSASRVSGINGRSAAPPVRSWVGSEIPVRW
ncbi:MAG: YbhN family protein [Actinomycetota bacterium]